MVAEATKLAPNNAAIDQKTAPTPWPLANSPAAIGSMNWPKRFPLNLAETASARSSASVRSEIKAIVKGCPKPDAKPATKTSAPKTIGLDV